MIKAEVLAHSVSEAGAEAITMRVVLPRIILAEFNTHRKISKNTSSSRAIPINKMIQHVKDNMFTPVWWGKNQPGMQAKEQLKGIRLWLVKKAWRLAGLGACNVALALNKLGLHKQITNRLIENFSYVTVVFTTSDLNNLFWLRDHPDAQPEFRELAREMKIVYMQSTPKLLQPGEWHLPFVQENEKHIYTIQEQLILSVARCASTSYQTVDGKALHPDRAKEIYNKLSGTEVLHASPFEHQLTPDSLVTIQFRVKGKRNYETADVWHQPNAHGNTIGWIQNRKLQPAENAAIDLPYFLLPKV